MTNIVARINITLPKDLILELKKTVPPRYRSSVIAGALSEKIAKMKREEGLKKLKGIWTKAGGPAFKSDKEVTAWRRALWSSTNTRFEKRIHGKLSGRF